MRYVAAFAVVLLLAACSRQVSGHPAGTPTSSAVRATAPSTMSSPVARRTVSPAPRVVSAWVNRSIRPMGSLVAVHGGFVSYAFDPVHKRFAVVGLRGSDGRVRWRAPASPSDITPGVGLSLAVQGNIVVYQKPGVHPEDGDISVIAADAGTGHPLWTYGAGRLDLRDNVAICGAGRRVCLDIDDGFGGNLAIVLGLHTGKQASLKPLDAQRNVGTELYDQAPQWLARISDSGHPIWSHSIDYLFPGPKVATDYGWDFVRDSARYIGWLGGKTPQHRLTTMRALPVTTAAFSQASGKRLWNRPGLALFCDEVLRVAIQDMVGCEMVGGTVTVNGTHTHYDHFQLMIEGIDPATGKARWRWNAKNADVIFGDKPLVRLSDTQYLITRSHTTYLIDAKSGVRPYAGSLTGWCADRVSVTPSTRLTTYPRAEQSYAVGTMRPCTEAGHHPALPATLPDFAVTKSAGVAAWSQSDGIHAATERR